MELERGLGAEGPPGKPSGKQGGSFERGPGTGGGQPLLKGGVGPAAVPASPQPCYPPHAYTDSRDARVWQAQDSMPNPRVYEVWPQVGGKSRFLFGGRCITGPRIDFWYNCCAWSFLVAPTALYFAFCAPYLWNKIHWCLPVLTLAIFLVTILFLLMTSCSDPGIIPRRALQVAVPALEERVSITTGVAPLALDAATGEPIVGQLRDEEGYRWCQSCKIVRPPRASHCRDCDNCVLRFDHHCPFVGNCVGQRNYGYFSGFLVATGCLSFSVFAGAGLTLAQFSGNDSLDEPLVWAMAILVGVPTAAMVIGVVGLGLFHLVLICRGRTTKEMLTGKVTGASGHTLFTMRIESLVRARERVSYPMAVV